MQAADEPSPDIDKGWAFVVLLCSTLTITMTRGLTYTGAIFYIIFLDEFEESAVFTSWAVSLNIFCSYIFCLVAANLVILMIGSRITTTIGCAFIFTGLITCSFATNLTTILAMYGFVTGCGNALSYVAAYCMVPVYFRRYRVIAYSVMNMGSGIGQLLFPILLRVVSDEYTWRGAFMILAAISLNLLVIGACFMSPRQVTESAEELESFQSKIADVFGKLKRNIKIFEMPRWSFHCIAFLCYCLSLNGYQTHISNYGRIYGLTEDQFTLLPSLSGAGSIVGSLVVGALTQVLKLHVAGMMIMTMMTLATFSVIVTFFQNSVGFFLCSFGVGFSVATIALVYEVIIHVVGLEAFVTGSSITLAFSGIGAVAGGPLAALIYEVDPSYQWSYRVLGLIAFTGALLVVPSWLTVGGGILEITKAHDDVTPSSNEKSSYEITDIPASPIESRTCSTETVGTYL